MNINKDEMEYAWNNRKDPKQLNILMECFRQMAQHMANRFKIKPDRMDDFKSEAMITALKGIEKYNPTKRSRAFSYFYKVFYISFMYQLRKQKISKKSNYRHISLNGEEVVSRHLEDEIQKEMGQTFYQVNGRSVSIDTVKALIEGKSRKNAKIVLEDYLSNL